MPTGGKLSAFGCALGAFLGPLAVLPPSPSRFLFGRIFRPSSTFLGLGAEGLMRGMAFTLFQEVNSFFEGLLQWFLRHGGTHVCTARNEYPSREASVDRCPSSSHAGASYC